MIAHKNFKLKELSYYKTGGTCHTLYLPKNKKELKQALLEIDQSKEPYFILGLGSNSLVTDDHWPGSVINLKNMTAMTQTDENTLRVESGVLNSDLAEFALHHKLGGASWMYGLPGFLGATVRMNARCYGGEISQIVTKVISLDEKAQEKTYHSTKNEKHVFQDYKKTVFMNNKEIITDLEISLSPRTPSLIKEKMISCYQDRKDKGQYLAPSCGCVFKNDYSKEVSVPSGLLIDFCELKGLKKGSAMVSHEHGNFIKNLGEASSQDILDLSFEVREKVWESTGVWLEYEMEILGTLSQETQEKLLEKRSPRYNDSVLDILRKKFREKKN